MNILNTIKYYGYSPRKGTAFKIQCAYAPYVEVSRDLDSLL